jgi:hypothetical protein
MQFLYCILGNKCLDTGIHLIQVCPAHSGITTETNWCCAPRKGGRAHTPTNLSLWRTIYLYACLTLNKFEPAFVHSYLFVVNLRRNLIFRIVWLQTIGILLDDLLQNEEVGVVWFELISWQFPEESNASLQSENPTLVLRSINVTFLIYMYIYIYIYTYT